MNFKLKAEDSRGDGKHLDFNYSLISLFSPPVGPGLLPVVPISVKWHSHPQAWWATTISSSFPSPSSNPFASASEIPHLKSSPLLVSPLHRDNTGLFHLPAESLLWLPMEAAICTCTGCSRTTHPLEDCLSHWSILPFVFITNILWQISVKWLVLLKVFYNSLPTRWKCLEEWMLFSNLAQRCHMG